MLLCISIVIVYKQFYCVQALLLCTSIVDCVQALLLCTSIVIVYKHCYCLQALLCVQTLLLCTSSVIVYKQCYCVQALLLCTSIVIAYKALLLCTADYERVIQEKMYRDGTGVWTCTDCGRSSKVKNNIYEHIEVSF